MHCKFCQQPDVDGAITEQGEYVCLDCWADGTARSNGEIAQSFRPAVVGYHVEYDTDMQRQFIDACNNRR